MSYCYAKLTRCCIHLHDYHTGVRASTLKGNEQISLKCQRIPLKSAVYVFRSIGGGCGVCACKQQLSDWYAQCWSMSCQRELRVRHVLWRDQAGHRQEGWQRERDGWIFTGEQTEGDERGGHMREWSWGEQIKLCSWTFDRHIWNQTGSCHQLIFFCWLMKCLADVQVNTKFLQSWILFTPRVP